MPKPRRPRDTNQLAKLVADISVGEVINDAPKESPRGQAGGLKGGAARAIVLTPKRRKEIAKKAATARWKVEAADE